MKLFTPKWKSKDVLIRFKWIEKVNADKNKNQEILLKIATNDENPKVRLNAIEKIKDKNKVMTVLYYLSRFDNHYSYNPSWKIRAEAYGLLGNRQLQLIEIVRHDQNEDARENAVREINNQDIIVEIVKNDESEKVVLAGINKITDQKILCDILVGNCNCIEQIAYFVKKLDNQNLIYRLAEEAYSNEVKRYAIELITDQNVLIKLLKKVDEIRGQNDVCDRYSKLAIISKLTDQTILKDIYINNNHTIGSEYRMRALNNITDKDFLLDRLNYEMDINVRELIFENINDPNILLVHAEKEEKKKKLSDLKSILKKLKNEKVSNVINNMILKHIDDMKICYICGSKSSYACEDCGIGHCRTHVDEETFYGGEVTYFCTECKKPLGGEEGIDVYR